MKTQLAQNVRERARYNIWECPERYQMTSVRWMDSSKVQINITKIVGQSCVPCKPLCCPPTLLTLPLKIRVPPANATHLYIIILQLLNILITSYGKYQILPNPHNTAQFNYACPATAQFNYACPATAQFNYACPATAQFKLCMPCYSTVQTMHALLQHSSNYACLATAQFNSRTLLSSSCQPLWSHFERIH